MACLTRRWKAWTAVMAAVVVLAVWASASMPLRAEAPEDTATQSEIDSDLARLLEEVMEDVRPGVSRGDKLELQNYVEAFEDNERLVLLALGMYYQKGHLLQRDRAKAAAFYKQAVATGETGISALLLARLYDLGQGVPQNHQKARHYSRVVALRGFDRHLEEDHWPSFRWGFLRDWPAEEMLEAAQNWVGDREEWPYELQIELGESYMTGDGVPQSNIMAHHWLSKARDSGAPEADTAYAQCLLSGICGHAWNLKDRLSSAELVLYVPARRGYTPARKTLGRLYADGHELMRSNARAYVWFTYAQRQGCDVEAELSDLEESLTDEEREQVHRWLRSEIFPSLIVSVEWMKDG